MNNFNVTPNLKPIVPYVEIFLANNPIVRPPSSSDEIITGLKVLFQKALQGSMAELKITQYLRTHLTNHEMAARKSSARDFEDMFALIFGGVVQDNIKNTEKDTSLIGKNKSKKSDVVFPETGLSISIKTFVETNKEINLGAFSAEALFEGFVALENERKQLGSRPQLRKVFQAIYDAGRWEEFVDRFTFMVETVFQDDYEYLRKGNDNWDIYSQKKENLHFILIESMKGGPESALKVITRFEGHSLRVDRDILLSPQFSDYLGFNFGYTQGFKLDEYEEAKRSYFFKDDLGLATEEDWKELQSKKPQLVEQKYTNVNHFSNFHKKIQQKFANGELDIHINFGYQQ